MDTELKNKHVMITGASGGIGLTTAKLFLEEGARVTAHYNTNLGDLPSLQKLYPNKIHLLKADLRKDSDVIQLFDKAIDHFQRIDVLVANAGIWPEKDTLIHEISLEQWQNTLAVNLTGIFLCTKYFFQNLKNFPQENASLILIGSTAGVFGEPGHSDYSATKAALIGLTKSLKTEITHLARIGRVNLINPGWTATPMAGDHIQNEQEMKRITQTIPLKKIAKTEDIANLIIFLSSDKLAGHISGSSVTIAGGMDGRVLFLPEEIDFSKILS